MKEIEVLYDLWQIEAMEITFCFKKRVEFDLYLLDLICLPRQKFWLFDTAGL